MIAEGTVIDGRYRVLRKIGAGGMADVYCAEDTHLGRKVALKLLHRTLAGASFVDRFDRERDILASLNYPDIARLYDAGVADTCVPCTSSR